MKIIKNKINYLIILIFIFITVTILAIIYAFLKDSYYESDGQSGNYTFYYKVFFCSLLFFLLIILFLSDNIKKYFLIVTFSSIFSLYLHEIMIRSEIFQKKDMSLPKNFDQRDSAEIVKELNGQNKKAFHLITPTNFLFSDGITLFNENKKKKIFPLGGVSNVLTPLCNELGEWVVYKSDRFGFNNPDINWDSSKIDFLLIGDSFAHGACARVNHGIRGQIEKKTNKTSLTLGFGGNGPLLAMASYLEFNKLINPDYLIWVYYEHSDLVDLSKEMSYSKILKNYFKNNFSQNLTNFQNEIDEELIDLYNKKIFLSILKLQRTRKNTIDFLINNFFSKKKDLLISKQGSELMPITNIKQLKNFEDILKRINKEVKKNNQKLLFVYLPSYERYAKKKNVINFYSKEIFEILNKNKILYLDVVEKFDNHKDPISYFPLRKSAHFTEEAYDMITSAIIKKFEIQ